jgi:sugar phosphate isomerase/epimerase
MMEIIERATLHGVGGVELMNFCEELSTPDMEMAKKLGKEARARGLQLPCFSAAADIYAEPNKMVDMLCRYAEICSQLEIPYLHHTVALAFERENASLTEEAREARFQACIEPVLRLCDYARSLGVRTLIEDQGFVFNGRKNCMRLCELSDERIGIVADTGNILFFDEAPEDFILAADTRICHAHVKDYKRQATPFAQGSYYQTRLANYLQDCALGDGIVDFTAVKNAFSQVSYQGMFAFELAGVPDAATLDRAIDFLCA